MAIAAHRGNRRSSAVIGACSSTASVIATNTIANTCRLRSSAIKATSSDRGPGHRLDDETRSDHDGLELTASHGHGHVDVPTTGGTPTRHRSLIGTEAWTRAADERVAVARPRDLFRHRRTAIGCGLRHLDLLRRRFRRSIDIRRVPTSRPSDASVTRATTPATALRRDVDHGRRAADHTLIEMRSGVEDQRLRYATTASTRRWSPPESGIRSFWRIDRMWATTVRSATTRRVATEAFMRVGDQLEHFQLTSRQRPQLLVATRGAISADTTDRVERRAAGCDPFARRRRTRRSVRTRSFNRYPNAPAPTNSTACRVSMG